MRSGTVGSDRTSMAGLFAGVTGVGTTGCGAGTFCAGNAESADDAAAGGTVGGATATGAAAGGTPAGAAGTAALFATPADTGACRGERNSSHTSTSRFTSSTPAMIHAHAGRRRRGG